MPERNRDVRWDKFYLATEIGCSSWSVPVLDGALVDWGVFQLYVWIVNVVVAADTYWSTGADVVLGRDNFGRDCKNSKKTGALIIASWNEQLVSIDRLKAHQRGSQIFFPLTDAEK